MSDTIHVMKRTLFRQKDKLKALGLTDKVLCVLGLLLVVVALSGVLFGYFIGLNRGKQIAHITTTHKGQPLTTQEIKAMSLENDLLKTQITTLTQERDIALANVAQTPPPAEPPLGDDIAPLQVLSMGLTDEGGDTYAYHFEVATKGVADDMLAAELVLLNPTSLVNIPQSSYTIDGERVLIHGKFVMPNHFHPSQIRLTLTAGGLRVVKFYDWQVS